jgi:L-cysteine:1D-myo-inositol 2-amino-2-deoxy-alpha-D-glucopyranoside ligase
VTPRIFDTARQAVVPFEPRAGRFGLYVCGITPYDAAHIGHAFTYHVFDVLTRRLRASGATVEHVRNVTDVDDDMLRTARKRNMDYLELGEQQVQQFDLDMSEIGLLPVDFEPRATRHVPEMVEWIKRLVDGGFAYAREGWVYFDVTTFPGYGSLSRLDEAAMLTMSKLRGADPSDPRKRHPLDFVLWQQSAEGEPSWPSPWSKGRPGWHIECTVLATGKLGHPIDIHGGGDDLIYPHHESEIAQAEAIGVTPYVRHWVHVAMVRYQGEKMSKSLGNLVFVRDLLDRVPGAAVRLLLASHHFRSSWTYDDQELDVASERLARYRAAMTSNTSADPAAIEDFQQRFFARLDDDLDTPGALGVLDEAAATAGGEAALGPLLDVLGVRVESGVA